MNIVRRCLQRPSISDYINSSILVSIIITSLTCAFVTAPPIVIHLKLDSFYHVPFHHCSQCFIFELIFIIAYLRIPDKKKYKCEQCNYGSLTLSRVKRHVAVVHSAHRVSHASLTFLQWLATNNNQFIGKKFGHTVK